VQFVDLLEIRELLQYQHVIGAVVCLGERPMRYGEMGNAITEWTGSRVGDGEITRTAHRLVDSGLAEESFVDGHRLFTLTPAGQARLETIRALGQALRGDEPEADGDGAEDGSDDR
jgi:DNA-binding PadR family transcriptional regulator